MAASQSNLANCLKAQGKLEQAEPLYRQAVAGVQKALGPEHPNVAIIRGTLASALLALGTFEEAEREYRRSIELVVKTLGSEHPTLVEGRDGLARVLLERGRPEEALTLAERAWARAEQGDIRPGVRAEAAFVLALALEAARPDQRGRARRSARKALDILSDAEEHHDEVEQVRRWLEEHPADGRGSRDP